MKTNAICPISNQKINETVARLNGLFTVLFLIAFALTGNLFIISSLLVDFLLRATNNSKYSVFTILSKSLVKRFSLKERFVNAGPKVFAARIGLVFSVSILVSSLFGFDTVSYVLTAVFGVCAFLESAFGLCIACEIYPFVYKFTYRSKLS